MGGLVLVDLVPFSWQSKVTPPKLPFPQEIAGLMIRDYENPLVSLNKALLGPYFLGGSSFGGVPLDSHDFHYVVFLLVMMLYWDVLLVPSK